MHVSRVGTAELAPTATVTVTVTKSDGTTVSKTATVGFYERQCQLGDFVYADGSYSDVYDEGRTVVAICCYIDPEEPTRRLGVAPRSIGLAKWGYPSSYSVPTISLSENNTGYGVTDIWDIPNVSSSSYTTIASNSDNAIRDTSEAGDANGFKIYPSSAVQSRIGFISIDKTLGNYPLGTILPVGLAETLKIITHRNRILRDSNVNLPVPVAQGLQSELDSLKDCIAAANSKVSTLGMLYWPVASYCYAYQPTVKRDETLADKFKCHMWFLPAPGDALRLSWLARQNSVDGSEFDVFGKAKKLNLMSAIPIGFPSTGEGSQMYIFLYATTSTGIELKGCNEYDQCHRQFYNDIYPMVQF